MASQVHCFSSFSASFLLAPAPKQLRWAWILKLLTWVLDSNFILLTFTLPFIHRSHHALKNLGCLPEVCIAFSVNLKSSALHVPIYLPDLFSHSFLIGICFFRHGCLCPLVLGHIFCFSIIGLTTVLVWLGPYGRALILPELRYQQSSQPMINRAKRLLCVC